MSFKDGNRSNASLQILQYFSKLANYQLSQTFELVFRNCLTCCSYVMLVNSISVTHR